MQRLLTITALFIAGRWLQPGAEVPLDVQGFDYAKAYRKGMLEADDGSEVINPTTEAETAVLPEATSAEPSSDEATLRTQAAQFTRERDEVQTKLQTAQGELTTTRAALGTAQTELQKAQEALKAWDGLDATTYRQQLADLTEYRDVLGELLPEAFPGRTKLFASGYYTLPMLDGVTKEALTALDGIGGAIADQILAALPAPATEG